MTLEVNEETSSGTGVRQPNESSSRAFSHYHFKSSHPPYLERTDQNFNISKTIISSTENTSLLVVSTVPTIRSDERSVGDNSTRGLLQPILILITPWSIVILISSSEVFSVRLFDLIHQKVWKQTLKLKPPRDRSFR